MEHIYSHKHEMYNVTLQMFSVINVHGSRIELVYYNTPGGWNGTLCTLECYHWLYRAFSVEIAYHCITREPLFIIELINNILARLCFWSHIVISLNS